MIYLFTLIFAFALMSTVAVRRSLNALSGLLLLTLLSVMGSIRHNTGTDYPTYAEIWNTTLPLETAHLSDFIGGFYEPLFAFCNAVLKSFTTSQVAFFSFYACLTVVLLHRGIRRLGISQPYAYLLYFTVFYLPYTFNGMRQALAMSFFIVAIPAILSRRTGAVILWALVAGGFHVSGFLIVVGYFFLRVCEALKLTAWRVFLITAALGSAMAVTGTVGRLFFLAFPGAVTIYSELFDEPSTWSNVALRIGLGTWMLLYVDQGKGDRRAIDRLIIVYCLGLLIYLSLFQFNVLATRFNMMFRVLEVVLFPLIAMRLSPSRRIGFVAVTLLVGIASLWAIAQHPDYDYRISF